MNKQMNDSFLLVFRNVIKARSSRVFGVSERIKDGKMEAHILVLFLPRFKEGPGKWANKMSHS